MMKITCIIPVYNEAPRIVNVLKIVCGHPLISEVLVVNDASNDGTAEVVKSFKEAKLISHQVNQGKTKAVVTGIKAAAFDELLLIDADLVGLTNKDLTDLIEPVVSGKADTTISLRKNSPWIDRVIGIDIFSGERVISKKLLVENLEEILKLPRFGFESYINRLIIKNKLRLKIVFWKDVISQWKYQKAGWVKGVMGDAKMILDILKTISVFQVIYQFYKLMALSV